jgi:predicted MFS family arabinose efflux permease
MSASTTVAPTSAPAAPPAYQFTPYQKFMVGMLAFLQFTIVLDFMILSPMGALLMPALHIPAARFGVVVSVYAFSAGISGLLAAGFADRFDRKRLLLFFYAGFILGTVLCSVATTYHFLLMARLVTGLFGGVIGSIAMAIIADMFPLEARGRVMGVVQTAFAASQVMGLPLGVWLSSRWGWHAPFAMIAAIAAAVGVVIVIYMRPITGHLSIQRPENPLRHVLRTVSRGPYLRAFATTMLLVTGGYMLMPFGSAFTVNNVGIPFEKFHLIYFATGVCAIVAGPLAGRISDTVGKYPIFVAGSVLSSVMVLIYTHLGLTPLWVVMACNAILFVGITARIISASALVSAVPNPADRGAFMSVNASLQQFAGGVASAAAGLIVVESADGKLGRYDVLGYVVVAAILFTVVMLYGINRAVMEKAAAARRAAA